MDENFDHYQKNRLRWAETDPKHAEQLKQSQRKIYDNTREKAFEWAASTDFKGIEVIFLYGLYSGYYFEVLKDWLKNPRHHLVILEDDLDAIDQFFHSDLASELLFNKQVRLKYIGDFTDHDWQNLVQLFGAREFIFVPSPSYEEQKPVDLLIALRSKITFWSTLTRYSEAEYANSGVHYYKNLYQNLFMLPGLHLAGGLFGKFESIPAIICGAGPSLDKNLPLLETLGDRALIFAGGTAMNAVNSNGFLPHFGLGIDPNEEQKTRLIMNTAYEVPFLFRGRFNHEALCQLHGPKVYATGSGTSETASWFEKQLNIDSKVVQEGFNVVNFSTAIACAFGCNPIIFVGIDLSYADQRSYQSGVISHPLHQKKDFRTKGIHEELLVKNDIFGNPTYTLWKWIAESAWYSRFAQDNPEKLFLNATEGGLGMGGIPNITLKEAADTFLLRRQDLYLKVHQELQQSRVPENVTYERIAELFRQMISSLKICSEYCLDRDEAKLKEEIAYRYLLKDFDRHFSSSRQLEQDQDQQRWEMLQNTAETHAALMEIILNNVSIKTREAAKIDKKTGSKTTASFQDKNCLYYDSGALFAKLNFENNQMHGTQQYFYEDGTLKTVMQYKQGKLDGDVRLYFPNGKMRRELHFQDGKRTGTEKIWDSNGQILIEAEYRENKPIGIARAWHPSGQLAQETIYDDQSQVISLKKWSENGSLLPDAAASGEDYFDAMTRQTNLLTQSLTNVVQTLSRVVPLVSEDAVLKEDFADLQKTVNQLKLLDQELLLESGLETEDSKEPIWKSPSFKRDMEKQIDQVADKLKKDVEYMKEILKKMDGEKQ